MEGGAQGWKSDTGGLAEVKPRRTSGSEALGLFWKPRAGQRRTVYVLIVWTLLSHYPLLNLELHPSWAGLRLVWVGNPRAGRAGWRA